MKRNYLLPFLLMMLSACSALGVPTPKTFNEREAAAIVTITSIRETATTLLRTDKITAADAQNIQDQADNARAALIVAAAIKDTDPAQAENRLAAIMVGLNAINTYLNERKTK